MINAASHRQRLLHLYRAILLPAFGAVLLAILWSAALNQIAQERLAALHEAVAHIQEMARNLGDHTNAVLRQADHATQLFKLQYEETGGKLRLSDFSRRNGLLDSVLQTRSGLPLAVIDASGQVVDSVNAYMPGNQARQPYFMIHAADPADVPVFFTPVTEPATHKWQIRISRRLDDRQGRFAGVIAMLVDPLLFVDDYDRLNIEDDGALLLFSRENGMAVGRVGERLLQSDGIVFVRPAGAQHPDEEMAPRRPLDGVDRIYSARELPRYGLQAVIGVKRQLIMARFEHHRSIYLFTATLASALVVVFVVLLMEQSRRLRHSMQEARETQSMLRAAARGSHDAVLLLKAWRPRHGAPIEDFVCADLNQRSADMMGLTREAILGRRICEIKPLFRQPVFFDKYVRALAGGDTIEDEFEVQLENGERLWLHHQVVPIEDGVAIASRDITARKRDELGRRQQELALRQNQAELAAVNDASPLGLVRTDARGRCTYVNRTFEAITGLRRDAALGLGWRDAILKEDRAILLAALARLRRTRQPCQATLRCRQRDGKMVWVSVQAAAIVIDGAIAGYVGSMEDITTQRASALALQESEARLRTIADTLPAMIAYIDAGTIYRFHNIAYEKEFGQGAAIDGNSMREALGEQRYLALQPYVERVLAGETLRFEEDEESGGVMRCAEVNYIPQLNEEDGRVIGFHVMRQDITMQKREEQRLLKLSQVDALTGLVNRAGFLQRLSAAMADCREHGRSMAVMYIDIDRFKPVNDTYGHAVGDALLKAFSARLIHTMRASDTIARLGGDEFTIIMEKLGRLEDATSRAARIVAAMQAPFDLDGIKVGVSASIGLTVYRDEDLIPARLLQQADMLLYRAKQAGRNTYCAATLAELGADHAA